MITERPSSTPRVMVELWLREAMKRAENEGAEFTVDKLAEISEPILSMVASSEAADPQKMRDLVARTDWPNRAHVYLTRNAPLLTGISGSSGLDASEMQTREAIARKIITQIRVTAGVVTDGSAETLSAIAEQVAKDLRPENRLVGHNNLWDGDAAAVLVREVLGLPGDHERCLEVTDPQILRNALDGMAGLGVDA